MIEESAAQIEEDECERRFPLVLEQGGDEEEEEIGVLNRREPHHFPISVASSPAPPESMSGTRHHPTLVKESPAPHYIIVEDSPAPQYIVEQESQVPMSGIKNHQCLVVESPPNPTEDKARATSQVPRSGTRDRPSLVDDSPAVPKVSNPGWGAENRVEGGSETLPINLVSPPSTTFPMEDPQRQVLPHLGDPEVARGLFLLAIRRSNHLPWLTSHHNILWWKNPHHHPRNRTLMVLSPLLRHPTWELTWNT